MSNEMRSDMTSYALYDLYAIGNALVDTEYEVTDEQLVTMGVSKRHMTLIDCARRSELEAQVTGAPAHRSGGGSAANTVVALAQLGGKACYACRVADDEPGQFYASDLMAYGVASNLSKGLTATDQTGSCMVLVTPDAERSMCTFLGATSLLDDTALQAESIAASKIYYMEGYLAASPSGLAAALKGRTLAQEAGVALAATLSDVSMINHCREGLDAIVGNAQTGALDYLFCNEEEAQAWCGQQDISKICRQINALARVVCITRSAKGCLVLRGTQQTEVPAAKVKAIDTNGAGDMFAGAFLYAVTHGHSHSQAAWLANQCAAQVVAQYGNRLGQAAIAALQADFARYLAS